MVVKIVQVFNYKSHSVSIATLKTRAGWLWQIAFDGGRARRGSLPLPLESLALREAIVVAKATVDNAQALDGRSILGSTARIARAIEPAKETGH